MNLLAIGKIVTAEMNDAITAIDNVSARSENNCPSIPAIKSIGKNIATLVAVDANNAPVTSKVPFITALLLAMPRLFNLTIFS